MLKTKTVRIDDRLYEPQPGATVADMVPWDVQSIITPSGALIPREQLARVPVPEGFDTNLSVINKGDDMDGNEAPPAAGSSFMHRLGAAHTALTGFFATSPAWRLTVAGGRLVGLSGLIVADITAGFGMGRLLLLNDAALQSTLDLYPEGTSFAVLRGSMLGAVVVGTVVAVRVAGAMRDLWHKSFGGVPLVRRILAVTKFTLQLSGAIMLAAGGACLLAILIPAVVREGKPEQFVGLALGLVFVGGAIHSIGNERKP